MGDIDLIAELRKQFDEMMASKGQPDHEYHLENYQCLALNIAPQMLDEIRRLRAEVAAYNADACRTFDLAQRLDAETPDDPEAFTGTPSERIARQVDRLRAEVAKLERVRDAALRYPCNHAFDNRCAACHVRAAIDRENGA